MNMLIQIAALAIAVLMLAIPFVALLSIHMDAPLDPLDNDFQACEQTRASGWTEEEIQDCMLICGGRYDKDYA